MTVAGDGVGRYVCAGVLAGVVILGALPWAGPADVHGQSPDAWQRLSPEEKERVRREYERFQQLPEQDRDRVHERYRRWQSLQPEQRRQLRENYENYRDLGPGERQRFDEGYRHWKKKERGAKKDR
jgi:hypothetical protein